MLNPKPFGAIGMKADAWFAECGGSARRRGIRRGRRTRLGSKPVHRPEDGKKPRSREMVSKSGNGLSRILWAALTLCLGSVGCQATFSFMEAPTTQPAAPSPKLPAVLPA